MTSGARVKPESMSWADDMSSVCLKNSGHRLNRTDLIITVNGGTFDRSLSSFS